MTKLGTRYGKRRATLPATTLGTVRHSSVRSRHLPNRSGFSLLEVMLSLTLAIILLGAIFTAMDQSWRLTASGREEMERSQVARALLRKMTLDIRSVMFSPPPLTAIEAETSSSTSESTSSSSQTNSQSTSSTNSTNSTTATDAAATETTTQETPSAKSLGVRGNAQRLELHVSRARRDLEFSKSVDGENMQSRTSDLFAVTYSLALAGSGSSASAGLVRSEGDRLVVQMTEDKGGTAEQASKSQSLAPEVAALQFRYFDGATWYETWDSQEAGYLPRAIEVSIGFAPPKTQGGPLLNVAVSSSANQFRTVVLIPVADPLPQELVP
jgi:type II secretory pathway component PulJ